MSLLTASAESLFSSEAQSDSSELLSVGESLPVGQPESLDKSSEPMLASDTFLLAAALLVAFPAEVLVREAEEVEDLPDVLLFSFEARFPTGLRLETRLPR